MSKVSALIMPILAPFASVFPKHDSLFHMFHSADVDECADSGMPSCHKSATCTNIEASYTCACASGFIGNGTYCEGMFATA